MRIYFQLTRNLKGTQFMEPAQNEGILRVSRIMPRKHGLMMQWIENEYTRRVYEMHKFNIREQRDRLATRMMQDACRRRSQGMGSYQGFKHGQYDRIANAKATFEAALPSLLIECYRFEEYHYLDFVIRDTTRRRLTPVNLRLSQEQQEQEQFERCAAVTNKIRDPAGHRLDLFIADLLTVGLEVSFKDNSHALRITRETFPAWHARRERLRNREGAAERKAKKPLDIPDDLDIL